MGINIVRATRVQQEFLRALDALCREQGHTPVGFGGGVVVLKDVQLASANLESFGSGFDVEQHRGGKFRGMVRFECLNGRTGALHERLPIGYEADADSEEIVDAVVVGELPSGGEK